MWPGCWSRRGILWRCPQRLGVSGCSRAVPASRGCGTRGVSTRLCCRRTRMSTRTLSCWAGVRPQMARRSGEWRLAMVCFAARTPEAICFLETTNAWRAVSSAASMPARDVSLRAVRRGVWELVWSLHLPRIVAQVDRASLVGLGCWPSGVVCMGHGDWWSPGLVGFHTVSPASADRLVCWLSSR